MTADHLGSPRIITDDDKDVVSRHDYLAFGDEVTETVGNVAGRTTTQGYGQDDDIRKQYTGYERDKESGLDFAQARYYNSQHGRFTSVDPLTASANVKNPQTFNRYSYVMNSPYKFTDPLGLLAVHSGSYGNGLEGGGGGGITGAMSSAWANPLFMKQQQQKDGKYYTAKDGTIQCRGDCETRLSTEITPEPIEQLPAVIPQGEQVDATFVDGGLFATFNPKGGEEIAPIVPTDQIYTSFYTEARWNINLDIQLQDTEGNAVDFEYEVTYDNTKNPDPDTHRITGRQKSDGGRGFLGTFVVNRNGKGKLAEIVDIKDKKVGGTVKIYASDGRTSSLKFNATVTGNDITITPRSRIEWIQPSQ